MHDERDERGFDFVVKEIRFVVERHYNRLWNIQSVNPDWHNLTFVFAGKSYYTFEGQEYCLQKGDLIFFPKGFVRSGYADLQDPWCHRTVHFTLAPANGTGSEMEWLSRLRPLNKGLSFVQLHQLSHTLYQTWISKPPGYMLYCRAIIMQILYMLIAHSSKSQVSLSREIDKVIQMIAGNPHRFYSIQELSREAGVSPSHFRLLFKKATGLSAIHYQNQFKVNMARDLMRSGECNVTETAERLGFRNVYYFSRLFKKMTGRNPSDYINA